MTRQRGFIGCSWWKTTIDEQASSFIFLPPAENTPLTGLTLKGELLDPTAFAEAGVWCRLEKDKPTGGG